ncbi:hypothetical protein GW17_00049500 [Ensete ventricosum]|nr:hypothetical protein GW17_00049500 [Ensete ventricosum]
MYPPSRTQSLLDSWAAAASWQSRRVPHGHEGGRHQLLRELDDAAYGGWHGSPLRMTEQQLMIRDDVAHAKEAYAAPICSQLSPLLLPDTHPPTSHCPPPRIASPSACMEAQNAQPFRWHYDMLDDKNFHVRGRCLLLLLVSFFALLSFALLCLYLWWACRYRRWEAETGSASVSSAAMSPCKAGLDADTIGSFPVHLHRAPGTGDEASQCSICLSCLMEGDKIKVLPGCSHGFHPDCVDEWLRDQANCPLCRASLDRSSVAEAKEAVP